jgi:hypothetical protein
LFNKIEEKRKRKENTKNKNKTVNKNNLIYYVVIVGVGARLKRKMFLICLLCFSQILFLL